MQPSIGIVVVNFNGREQTLRCLESLLRCQPAAAEIVLVDNASTDGSREAFRARFSGRTPVVPLLLEANTGYAGGNNRGIERLLTTGTDVILLLNNDTTVHPDFLAPLAECLAAGSGNGLAAPKILCADGKTIWSAGERVFYPLLVGRRSLGRPDGPAFAGPRRINSLTGCALAARREVFLRIGLLDEQYFAYVEELDFCKRARDAGFRIAYCPSSVVVHVGGGSFGEFSPLQVYLKARNRIYFYRKNFPRAWLPVSLAWHAAVSGAWAVRALLRRDPDVLRALRAGWADGMAGRMGPPRRAGLPARPA